MAQEYWENLTADAVLKELFDRLRQEPYFERVTSRLYEQAQRQWTAARAQNKAISDKDFVRMFVRENVPLFDEVKASIAQIFDTEDQFAVHRNPDLCSM
jgi:hypothetical protein